MFFCIFFYILDNGRDDVGGVWGRWVIIEEEEGGESWEEDGIGGVIIEEEIISFLLKVLFEREMWLRLCFCWGIFFLIRNGE